MKQVRQNNLPLWQFDNLSVISSVKHFVTGRHTEGSEGEFTLSYSSLPDKEKVKHNRRLLAGALGVTVDRLFLPSQVHKTRIVNVTSKTVVEDLMETDALVSNEPDVCIAVMSADCVPVLLYDKKNHAVGAVHAGWRGTVAKILQHALTDMQSRFGSRGEDIIAGIGPSVCQDSYEVGEEVIQAVQQSFENTDALLSSQKNGKARLDLWMANKVQLLAFGVPESQIEIADLCTVKNNDHFFSARKGDTGRFAAGIMVE